MLLVIGHRFEGATQNTRSANKASSGTRGFSERASSGEFALALGRSTKNGEKSSRTNLPGKRAAVVGGELIFRISFSLRLLPTTPRAEKFTANSCEFRAMVKGV